MIPSIETIVSDLKEGKISAAQAVTALHRHAADAYRDLRDEFAMASLAALSRDFRSATGISDNIRNMAALNARLAYCVADAMMAEREKAEKAAKPVEAAA